MSLRVTSTRFVGRAAQLAELEAAWRDASDGRATLAFVAGESGVGKSRLLRELVGAVDASGGRLLSGDCVELGEGELPYAPLVSALRPLARGPEGPELTATLAAAHRAELAAFLPGLAGAEQSIPREPADAQGRLFEALLSLLEALAAQQPLCLIVEDLHWADRSTRAFLAFLARALGRQRLLVVASYRPDELHRRHPLRPLLAELEREPHARHVALAPLERPELEEQLTDILGAAPDAGLVERLWTRSEGNPLHTEELLAAGLDGRGTAPSTLRDALMLRVERLDAPTQEVVRLLAAATRTDHAILADAAGVDPTALRDALREAVASHVVCVDGEGNYAFRHALLREVVADDLLPGERTDLHGRLARAYEAWRETHGDGPHISAEVAHHQLAAGNRPAALDAAIHAATQAERVHAHGEAADLLERALELQALVPGAAERPGRSTAELLVRTAGAHAAAGTHGRAETLLRGALAELGPDADLERRATLLVLLAHARWALGRQEDALLVGEEALAVLGEDHPGAARAGALGFLAKAHMLMGRYRRSVEESDGALAEAAAAGLEEASVTSRTLNTRGVGRMALGELDAGRADFLRAMELSRAGGRVDELGTAHVNLADGLHLVGRTAEAVALMREGLAKAVEGGHHHDWIRHALAEFLLDVGAWQETEELLRASSRPRVGNAEVLRLMTLGTLALRRGDPQARDLLDRAARLAAGVVEPQFIGPIGAWRAELLRREGALEDAAATVEEALGRMVTCTDDAARIARVAAQGVTVQADLAVREALLGRAAEASAARRRAAELEELVAAGLSMGGERPVERAELLAARADRARADGREQAALHERAADAWTELGRPPAAAARRLRAVEAHVAAGDRDRAAEQLALARAVIAGLGRAWLATEAAQLATRARLPLDARSQAPDAPAVVAAPFGLTPRELEVLALVAAGATNREVGTTLFMAEKTASVHVSRILAKLDVRSRTQAAAVAHRLGLERAAT